MSATTFATDTRLRPLTAIRAVRALKANPEDTSQIFVIFRALRGRSGEHIFRRFAASPTGQTILREKRNLLPMLENRAALAALPNGSMGRAYLDFMEQENLSAAGLVAASQSWEQDAVPSDVDLFRNRMRDAHDLTHILTGYGRDPLGELCLLAFMNRHSKNPGQLLIVAMSWTRLPKAARAAVLQAWRNGAKARWFQNLDYETLLARLLDEVRRELNIPAPTRYRAAMA
ncbi:MAG TPA: Coq4 family protein [Rhizomicrobium sp.]|jgi:ubiquinone biosynthesis protein COQ4